MILYINGKHVNTTAIGNMWLYSYFTVGGLLGGFLQCTSNAYIRKIKMYDYVVHTCDYHPDSEIAFENENGIYGF